MSSMFKTPKIQQAKVEKPPTKRMPLPEDPEQLEAESLRKNAAMLKAGRLATVLSDRTSKTAGKQTLGGGG